MALLDRLHASTARAEPRAVIGRRGLDDAAAGVALSAGTLWLAEGGALRCRTAHSLHVLPPTLALWVPAQWPHRVEALGQTRLRGVEVAWETMPPCTPACRVVAVGPLLAALVAAIDDAGNLHAGRRHRLARQLLQAELQATPPVAVGIPLPRASALLAACESVLHGGARDCPIQGLEQASGLSERALARRFKQELGIPFSHWRLQVRLARAIELWAEGRTLGDSACAVGYASPSAFSYMVRRLVGMSPRRLLGNRRVAERHAEASADR